MQNVRVHADPEIELGQMNIDETDFESFTLGQRIHHLEVEGYVVLADMLDAGQIDRLREELADAPMEHKDYSEAQTYHREPQWQSRAVAELIAHPPMIDFLEQVMGPDIIFTRGLLLCPAHRRSPCTQMASPLARRSSATRAALLACCGCFTIWTICLPNGRHSASCRARICLFMLRPIPMCATPRIPVRSPYAPVPGPRSSFQ